MILKPDNHEEWLKARLKGIGGSDAGAVLGKNKYKNNVELWREKTGKLIPKDISDKPAVRLGKSEEEPLRELFRHDHPQYDVDYHEFYMYINDDHPFIFATLDGELTDKNGRRGILEIKTTTIQNQIQWREWETAEREPRIPDSYFAQIIHQLAATGWEFAALKAKIRYYRNEVLRASVRHYFIERSEVENEIEFLIEEEKRFWKCVTENKEPALILPEI